MDKDDYIILDSMDESGMVINTTDEYITISNDVTLDINHHYGHTIDVSSITTSTDDLISMDGITLTLNDPVEFEDQMPSVSKVEDMCKDYPALAQAYEKFKTIYAMVHQDWKGKQEDDEQLPF
jgi:hypothetical protein